MATAEEAVSRHAGSVDERSSVEEMAAQRGQEDHRQTWMARHAGSRQEQVVLHRGRQRVTPNGWERGPG